MPKPILDLAHEGNGAPKFVQHGNLTRHLRTAPGRVHDVGTRRRAVAGSTARATPPTFTPSDAPATDPDGDGPRAVLD